MRKLLLLPLLLLTSCKETTEKEKYKYCVHFETYSLTVHYVCSRVEYRTDSSWIKMYTKDYGEIEANGNYLIYELPNKCPVCGWEGELELL